jgi:signal transduction histidine kinase
MIFLIKHWINFGYKLWNRLIRKALSVVKIESLTISSSYKTWRNDFLWKRIGINLWITIFGEICLVGTSYFLSAMDMHEKDSPPIQTVYYQQALVIRLVLTFIGLVFYKLQIGRRQPLLLLLYLYWSVTLFPELWGIITGTPAPSEIAQYFISLEHAVFAPVYWPIHLIAQLGGYIGYGISYSLIKGGWHKDLNYSTVYFFLVSLICNSSVYYQEKLQMKEFASRFELNILLNSVSHDLRAPVMGSSMVITKLIAKSQSTADTVAVPIDTLKRLLAGSNRQLNIINALLEAQNTEVGGVILHKQTYQISNLVRSILEELEPILQKDQVTVTNQIGDDLPLLNVDPDQLWRVFNNLINNALKHNPPGIDLLLSAYIDEGFLLLRVRDNGLGIDPPQHTRLFELYTRGRAARYMPGLGIGLYVCKKIIAAHGGEIGVNSQTGYGSTFWFTLPLANALDT